MLFATQKIILKRSNTLIFHLAPWVIFFLLLFLDITEFTSDVDYGQVILVIAAGVIPACLIYLIFSWQSSANEPGAVFDFREDAINKFKRRLYFLFYLIFFGEVIYFGYVPLVAMLRGGDVTHFDFGLPGLHGLLYALGTALATIESFLFLITNKRKYLFLVALIVICFVLLVTRKVFLTIILQAVILYFYIYGFKGLIKVFFILLLLILMFGYVGDIRTGRDLFLALAALKFDYPEWLPSGLIWMYIYIITPVLNYVNMVNLTKPDFVFVDLFSWLIPPRVLAIFTGQNNKSHYDFDNEWQISSAFNVASGFSSIYPTLGGHVGVIIFSIFLGWLLYKFRSPRSLPGLLSGSVICSCSLLMLFNNNFFSLNNIFQLIIFWYMWLNREFKNK